MHSNSEQRINKIIKDGFKREDVFALIPEGSSRILEIGYGNGSLLLRLKKEKNCTDLYGIEIDPNLHQSMEGLIDGNWNIRLGEDDNHLDTKFDEYFDWIIMHDVLEHMYDPWYFLSYIRRYISSKAKLILVCPNAQYWQTIFSLLHGDFPYGLDGHYNEDHIRWFTPKSMIEMALLSGLKVEDCHLLLTSKISQELAEFLQKNKEGKLLPMPPVGISHHDYLNYFPPIISNVAQQPQIEVLFQEDTNNSYLSFYAVKMILVCSLAKGQNGSQRLTVGSLKKRRKEFLENTPNINELLPKEWKAYIWQSG